MVTTAPATGVAGFLDALAKIAPRSDRAEYTLRSPDGAYGFVQFIVRSSDMLTIHRLWTLQPGRGVGSHMLNTLCELADRHGVALALKVAPIGRKPYPLAREQLLEWYQRHGFEGTRKKLIRLPRTVNSNGDHLLRMSSSSGMPS
jgi:ribosomal protein S18 acetylase RimI-like enzyme